MPEGDTIFRTATVLATTLAGKDVRRFEAPGVRVDPPLVGTPVRSVESRGKHLLISFGDERVLHTHLRMSGSWHVYPTGAVWRRPAHRMRALIEVTDAVGVCFDAPVVELLSRRELARHPRLSTLGPDLCDPDADLDDVIARLARLPASLEIGIALLDQGVASGIGNVYKSETLFACRVDPFARLAEVEPRTRRALYATASRLLRRNLGGGRRATAPGGLAVYGKARRPCPRCGTPIAARRQGEGARITFWCPSCQPGRDGGALERRSARGSSA